MQTEIKFLNNLLMETIAMAALVFGYGSLLLQKEAERTVLGINYLYNALLPGYHISCTRFSKRRNGGVADVVQCDSSCVWGVVYHVDDADLEKLDRREGVPCSIYRRENMTVFQNGDKNAPVTVVVYTVVNKSQILIPCAREYRDLIVQGAMSRKLPDEYIHLLQTIPVMDI